MVEVRSCRFNLESHVVVRLIVFVEQDEIYQVPMIPRVSLRITPWNAMLRFRELLRKHELIGPAAGHPIEFV